MSCMSPKEARKFKRATLSARKAGVGAARSGAMRNAPGGWPFSEWSAWLEGYDAEKAARRAEESEPCLDCDGQGHYPSGAQCQSCRGVRSVPKGSNGDVIAY